jgi:hypothetical protein
MSTDHFMYRGDTIKELFSAVESADKRPVTSWRKPADPLKWYIMQDSRGCTSGEPFEMHESQSLRENFWLSEATSDYRWVVIPERGWR